MPGARGGCGRVERAGRCHRLAGRQRADEGVRNLAEQIPGTDLYIMRKRGIFKTAVLRGEGGPRALQFSANEIAEIEYRFAALMPYLTATAE